MVNIGKCLKYRRNREEDIKAWSRLDKDVEKAWISKARKHLEPLLTELDAYWSLTTHEKPFTWRISLEDIKR